MGSAGTLTLEDAEAILEEVPDVVAVAPTNHTGMQIIAGSNNMNVRITGVTPEYQQVFNTTVASGDFIDQYEYDRKSKVALIGPEVAATLFGEDDPVGQKIRMGNTVFTIIWCSGKQRRFHAG